MLEKGTTLLRTRELYQKVEQHRKELLKNGRKRNNTVENTGTIRRWNNANDVKKWNNRLKNFLKIRKHSQKVERHSRESGNCVRNSECETTW